MSQLRPIEVMISSQVKGLVGTTQLGEIRTRIADRLLAIQVDGTSVMRVWLSEEQGALGQDATTWDKCMDEARRCDVLVVLYTGKAGWVRAHLGIGICHAEWQTGVESNPQKVRVVRCSGPTLDGLRDHPEKADGHDLAFYRALEEAQTWRVDGGSPDEVVDKAVEAVWLAILDLVRTGRQAGSRGKNLSGLGLRWANLDFEQRETAMLEALTNALIGDDKAGRAANRQGAADSKGGGDSPGRNIVRGLDRTDVAFRTHAVPGPFALPEARASLGQPFRDERELLDLIERNNAVGPVHVIAVQQNVTETQARKFIGRPDAFVAAQSFGIFVSDDSSFTQALFLANCRDPDRVSNGVSLAFEWWRRSGLERQIAERARARTAILKALRDLAPREPAEPRG